jgi:hypothetical protein
MQVATIQPYIADLIEVGVCSNIVLTNYTSTYKSKGIYTKRTLALSTYIHVSSYMHMICNPSKLFLAQADWTHRRKKSKT